MFQPTKITIAVVVLLASAGFAVAQRGFRGGHGRGPDDRHAEDQEVFHFLLANHDKIKRTVKELPNGVETVTESDDPKIAAKIAEHVKWMEHRIKTATPIRRRDPLFAEVFRHSAKIKMQVSRTPRGVKVVETSDDPHVVRLIQAHAKVVSGFVERGFDEATKMHAVPGRNDSTSVKFVNPKIAQYGKVVNLPSAKHQPRDGSRLLVDVTKGGEPDVLNPAIGKAARFVNIFAGAGARPAEVKIAVVLHGDATLAVLNADAYARQFKTNTNPNLDCLRELHVAGVEIYVCGQSLTHAGAQPGDVAAFADVAVSALTALINLQEDGYRYVPLLK